jgi:hypothetical protein
VLQFANNGDLVSLLASGCRTPGEAETVTPRAILICGRNLIRQGWCQGDDAHDANGDRVEPWSMEARSWSVLGALVATEGVGRGAVGRIPVDELGRAIVVLGEAANTHSLEAWNDDARCTQRAAIGAFDGALALLEEREPASSIEHASAVRAGGN